MSIDKFQKISSSVKSSAQSHTDRARQAFKVGIDFFDDALGGIFPDDLILLGAATGRGKTQLATLIGYRAAQQGKRVYMFALEAAKTEIQRRVIALHMGLSEKEYSRYLAGDFDSEILNKQNKAVEEIEKQDLPFYVQYKHGDFGEEQLRQNLISYASLCDLFIIDHFHFLDFEDSKSENQGQKLMIKQIRDSALITEKPVVLVAHMNKAFGKNQDEIPGVYDFYGSSDLPNLCTKVLTITGTLPKDFEFESDMGCYATVLHVAKNRENSATTRCFAIAQFDSSANQYRKGYFLFDLATKKPIEIYRRPYWAKNAIIGPSHFTHLNERT